MSVFLSTRRYTVECSSDNFLDSNSLPDSKNLLEETFSPLWPSLYQYGPFGVWSPDLMKHVQKEDTPHSVQTDLSLQHDMFRLSSPIHACVERGESPILGTISNVEKMTRKRKNCASSGDKKKRCKIDGFVGMMGGDDVNGDTKVDGNEVDGSDTKTNGSDTKTNGSDTKTNGSDTKTNGSDTTKTNGSDTKTNGSDTKLGKMGMKRKMRRRKIGTVNGKNKKKTKQSVSSCKKVYPMFMPFHPLSTFDKSFKRVKNRLHLNKVVFKHTFHSNIPVTHPFTKQGNSFSIVNNSSQ
jgi:hypothetical protein